MLLQSTFMQEFQRGVNGSPETQDLDFARLDRQNEPSMALQCTIIFISMVPANSESILYIKCVLYCVNCLQKRAIYYSLTKSPDPVHLQKFSRS